MHEFTSPFVDEKLNLLQSVPFFTLKPNLDKWLISGNKIKPKTLKSWIERDLYKTYIVYIVDLDRLISRPETNLIQLTKVYEAYTGLKFPVSPNFCSSFTNVDRIVCENEDTVIIMKVIIMKSSFLHIERLGMYFSSRKCILRPGAKRSVILWCWLYIYKYIYVYWLYLGSITSRHLLRDALFLYARDDTVRTRAYRHTRQCILK